MNTSATGGHLLPAEPVELDSALEDVLGNLVAGVTGLDRNNHVRPRWQPKPPARPTASVNWVAVGVLTQIPDDNAYLKQYNDSHQLVSHEQVEVMLSFYGPSARAYAGIFKAGVQIDQNRYTLQTVGIDVVEVGGPVNAADVVDNEWLAKVDVKAIFTREVGRTYQVLTFVSAAGAIHTEALTIPFSVNEQG